MKAPNLDNSLPRHPLENKIPPPLVVVVLGAAMGGIAWFTSSFEIGVGLRFVAGGLVIALGAGIVILGATTFWRARTTIDPVNLDSASSLVTGGVFGYTRNPMYVGFAAMLIGWAVCLSSPWALLGPVVFVLFTTRFQIIPEERVMNSKFGQEYAEYWATVRRWL